VANDPATSATSAVASSLTASPWDIEFELAREVIYHRGRQAWFDGLQRTFLFTNIVLGTAAVSAYFPAQISGIVIAVCSALTLAMKLPEQARFHGERVQRYCEMAERLTDTFNTETAAALRKEMLRLSATEPAPHRAVNMQAYNEALVSCKRDAAFKRVVTPLQFFFRHLWRFDRADFPQVGTADAADPQRAA